MSQHQEWNPQTSQSYSGASYQTHPSTPGMNAYSSYGQPAGGSHTYGSSNYGGSHYYSGGQMLSPQSTGHGPSMSNQLMPLPGMHTSSTYSQPSSSSYGSQHQPVHDNTGQVQPPGVKQTRVTATLWEDEGTICFQVECNGLCVARREDNHFINGTKLLNVAGMTRGRRDGILKSEKTRNVVKIGPMHLKGVWIPFERALEFANREKITEKLYPLFVHQIGSLIPQGQSARNGAQAISRGKIGGAPPMSHLSHPMVPSIPQHQSMQLPSQLTSRPGLERSHTFPTPPTSASSVINSDSQYWNQPGMNNSMSHGSQPLSVDTNNMNSARSMPSTPASTPPAHSLQSMSSFNHQSLNSTPAQYGSQYPQTNGYLKSEMGPPTRANTLPSTESKDMKQDQYSNGTVGHENGHDQNGAYSQDSHSFGNGSHNSYSFSGVSNVPQMPSMQSEPDHMGSAHHDTATGQITPRTSVSHDQWTGYQTPPRTNPNYSAYPSSIINGSNKRAREDDDSFKLDGNLDHMKRRKSLQHDMNAPRPGMMAPVAR